MRDFQYIYLLSSSSAYLSFMSKIILCSQIPDFLTKLFYVTFICPMLYFRLSHPPLFVHPNIILCKMQFVKFSLRSIL